MDDLANGISFLALALAIGIVAVLVVPKAGEWLDELLEDLW